MADVAQASDNIPKGYNKKVLFVLDNPYEDDMIKGVVLSGLNGEYLKNAMVGLKVNIETWFAYTSVSRIVGSKNYNKEEFIDRVEEIGASVVVCMGVQAISILQGKKVDFEKYEQQKGKIVEGFKNRAYWIMCMMPPHIIKEGGRNKKTLTMWKSKIRESIDYARKSCMDILGNYNWIGSDCGEFETSNLKWKNNNPLFVEKKSDHVQFVPLDVAYDNRTDKVTVYGTEYKGGGTVSVIIEEFLFSSFVVVDLMQFGNSVDSLKSKILENVKFHPRLFHQDDLKSIEIINDNTVIDINNCSESKMVKILCESWKMLTKIVSIIVKMSKDPATCAPGMDRNTAEIQVSLALVDRMRKICTIARHDTYLKNKSGCDINLSGSIQDIRLGEVCRLPDLESIEERAVHRTLFLHVVYGGVVSSEETPNVFCVCFGGDKGDDLMIIGKNGIKTERDLLTLVFKRLGKIKPMVIMGYQARRDMFLMLKRFRYLSGEVELVFAGRFEKGEALKTDICRNEKFKSYPLRQNGSDDAYKFSNVAGVAILDIKEILFRYFREEFMDVFKLDFAWITPKKAEQLMGAGQCETISKWCLKVVKELMKYEETRKLFRFMCGMCFETGWKYTPRTIMDVSVVEIAEAAVYKGKKLTKEGLFRAGDYMILDNQEELSEYAMQSKHVVYSSRHILKFGDCEDVPHTETISDEIGKWKNYVSQKKERICVLKEVRGALAETIVKLKISPEGENLFGKKLEAFERSINLPTTSDNVVQIKEYFKKCVVYTLQVAYGNEIRDRLILETKKRIETYIRESGQQVIAWNIFGTIILKCSDEYVNANGFDVAHRLDKILVCKSLMLFFG